MTTSVLGVACAAGWCLSICFILLLARYLCSQLQLVPAAQRSSGGRMSFQTNAVLVTGHIRMQVVRKGFGISHQLVFISVHSLSHFQRYLVPLRTRYRKLEAPTSFLRYAPSPLPYGHLLSSLQQFCYFFPLLLPLSLFACDLRKNHPFTKIIMGFQGGEN